MISNATLLGYIENTVSGDSVELSIVHGVDTLHLDGFDGVEEIAIEKVANSGEGATTHASLPPLRTSFGSAPSLGYIENSSIEEDKGAPENILPHETTQASDNFVGISPISLRTISTTTGVGSSPMSSVVFSVHGDSSYEGYSSTEGYAESDEDYFGNIDGSLSSVEDTTNRLTDEDFSNISLFLDEQQAAMPFEAIPSPLENEVVMSSLGLKLLPMHLSPSLSLLDLSHNELQAITAEIQHLTILSQLLLWDNLISSIDSSIGLLQNLRVLDLNHNSLSRLPSEVNLLRNLEQLLLVNNKFTEFPDIFLLPALQSLHLEMNKIERVPAEIGQLTLLTELILTNNLIVDVPPELFRFSFLKELRLSHNRISFIPDDLYLPNLETLTLDHNDLITLVPEIFEISSLDHLDLSHNRIHELPDMDALTGLMSLNLNNNQIDELPASVGSLTSLQFLYLYNNNLKSLPVELVGCSQLMDLGLGGNELPSIYNMGTSAVLSILRDSASNTTTMTSSPPVLHDWEINFHELEFYHKIGEGAFGQVFQGRWRGNDVAIKKLFSESLLEEKTMREFRREVGMLSRLKPYKHLVRYFGACTQPPHLFIINEFIPRGSLHDLLHESNVEISWSLLLRFAMGTALGCHYLINNDPPVYHCDLKAKNLLITSDWNIKLGDFGQSTFENATSNSEDWTYVRFAAPEIFKKSPHSEKSEVFSFGVILWELITRRIPYQHQEPEYVKLFIQHGGRLEIPVNCPPAYKELLIDCWREDPFQRPTFMEIYLRLRNMETAYY